MQRGSDLWRALGLRLTAEIKSLGLRLMADQLRLTVLG